MPVAREVVPVQSNEPKKLTVPTGQLKTSNLSITELYQKEKDKSNTLSAENQPRESFSSDQLKMVWRQFAYLMKEKSKDTIYHAMSKRDPVVVNATELQVTLDNIAQEGQLQRVMQDLLDYLREHLKNYDISITLLLNDNPEEEKTGSMLPKDQFTAMARKYPNLHSFKNAFNLDFEF